MKKINVLFSKDNNHAVTDCNAASWYQTLLACSNEGGVQTAVMATGTMLNELRIGVRLKEIEPFEFQYEGQTIKCGEQGQLDSWPLGLFDELSSQMYVLMSGCTREEAAEKSAGRLR